MKCTKIHKDFNERFDCVDCMSPDMDYWLNLQRIWESLTEIMHNHGLPIKATPEETEEWLKKKIGKKSSKEKKKEKKRLREELIYQRNHPDDCHCINPPRSIYDKIVGEFRGHSKFDYYNENPITYFSRKCQQCGKKYFDVPAQASFAFEG